MLNNFLFFCFQFIWLFSIVKLGPVTYGEKPYPEWAVTLGWCLGALSLIPIPICLVYQILREEGTLIEVWSVIYLKAVCTVMPESNGVFLL